MKKHLLWCILLLAGWLNAQTTVTIGAGVSTSGTNDNGNPIYRSAMTSTYHWSQSAQLLTTADLVGASVPAGSLVNSIGYNKTTGVPAGSNSWTLNVYLKNSSATALASGSTWATMTTGATLFHTSTVNSSSADFPATGWVNWQNNTGNSFTYTGGAIEVYIDWVPVGTLASPYTTAAFLWKYDTSPTAQALGTSNSAIIPATNTAWSLLSRRFQTQLTYTAVPCSGTPAPGNTLASQTTGTCPGPYNTTLSTQNVTSGSGVTYQWYKDGAAISGATGSTYNALVTAASTYYVAVTCGGSTVNSSPVNLPAPTTGLTTLDENFDTTATGSIVPACWTRLAAATNSGQQTVTTTTPFSAPNNLYMYATVTQTPVVVVLPSLSNINAGTHQLRLRARVNTATGALMIGYVTDATDASTFVAIQTLSIANTTYNSTSEYTVAVPASVPATAKLAIKNTADGKSYYMDNIVWEVIPTCLTPSGLTITGQTANSIGLSWTAPTPAPAGGYEIYYSTTNTAPTAATVASLTATGTSANVTGLTADTPYYFWVRSVCSASDKSAWTSPALGGVTGYCIPVAGTSSTSYYLNNVSTTGAQTNISYTASAYTAYVNQTSSVVTSYPGGSFDYSLATSGGSTYYYYMWIDWNNDLDFADANETVFATTTYSATNTGTLTIPATAQAGDYRVRVATSYSGAITACGPAPYGNYVDFKLTVVAPPSCGVPTAVAVTATSSSTGNVTWTAPATAPGSGYEIYVSTTNTPPVATTTPTQTVASGTTATLNGLAANTTYYVWIRSNCSSTDKSVWTTAAQFTTLCTATTVPWSENFDAMTSTGNNQTSVLPACWTTTPGGASNSYPFTTNDAASHTYNDPQSPNYYMTIYWPYTNAAYVWTPDMNLTQGVTYTFAFSWVGDGYSGWEADALVKEATATTYTTLGNFVAPATTTTNTYTAQSYTFTPTTTGVYKFGFRAFTASSSPYYLGFDDISVTDASMSTNETASANKGVQIYPNPFSETLNIDKIDQVKSVTIIDASGRTVKRIAKPESVINTSDLSSGMYLVKLEMKDGSTKTVKAIRK